MNLRIKTKDDGLGISVLTEDGEELHGVFDVRFSCGAEDRVPLAELSVWLHDLDVEVVGDVNIVDVGGKRYRIIEEGA